MDDVNGYLSSFDTSFDVKAKNLYEEKFLHFIRAASQGSDHFIMAQCAAEMKKSVLYKIDVKMSSDGCVCETQCECAVGMGPEAHCKHVQCVLFAIVRFGDIQEIVLHETCTQRLQTFHRCRPFKGSPLKSSVIQLRTPNQTCQPSERSTSHLATFDPRPANFIMQDGYQDYFNNLCVGFQSCKPCNKSLPMPILQTIPPANMYAISNDHDYLEKHPEHQFLDQIGVTTISTKAIENIEKSTRGQASNRKWYEERDLRLHSSSFGRICKATDRTDFDQLAHSLSNNKILDAAPLRHGRKYEPVAIRKYEEHHHVNAEACGIYVCETHPFLACSPDRIVHNDGEMYVVEVKCPYASRDREITTTSVPYMEQDGENLKLKEGHDYYYQVQGQLLCTNCSYCDFVVYTFIDFKICRVFRDDAFIGEMISKLQWFFDNYYRSALLKKHMYKGTHKYVYQY